MSTALRYGPWRNGRLEEHERGSTYWCRTDRARLYRTHPADKCHINITFIDKNKELNRPAECGKILYRSNYFGDGKEPVTVTGYDAYTTADEEVIEKLAHSDLITTSVFAGI